MVNLGVVEGELIAARPYFKKFSPGPSALIKHAGISLTMKLSMAAYGSYKAVKAMNEEPSFAHFVGDFVGGRIIAGLIRPAKREIRRTHVRVSQGAKAKRDFSRKNGMGGRSWITEPGQYQMVIVFHDANRAGPHIDVHIGQLSMVYRVKPDLYAKLRYNNQGYLTEDSKKLLINHVRSEIANGARVPQNLDHTRANGTSSWVNGDPEGKNYGDGRTRQVISESTVNVYKTGDGHPIELYAPVLNPNRSQYIYKIYPGDGKSAPILIFGTKTNQPPALEDRLHLKMVQPDDVDKIKADMTTITGKYDGSSVYFIIDSKGTHVYSPRQSVKTGQQIEYTFKLDGVAKIHSDEKIIGMGEVLFREKKAWWDPRENRNPYLPASAGSGILNSNAVTPSNIESEIRIYRIDKVGRSNTNDLPFWENRALQEQVATLDPQHLKVVELMDAEAAYAKGFEGFVVVPEGHSVNDGIKVKWFEDAEDWRVDSVQFFPGEKGRVAGVVHYTNLENGKTYKLGPSSTGNEELTRAMMADPDAYVGTVFKVQSRQGHSGRAAKVLAIHDDKGYSAV